MEIDAAGPAQCTVLDFPADDGVMADKFIVGLKSRSDEVRLRAAKELQRSITTELREVSNEEYQSFWDELNHQIFELVSSSDVHEKKGGILAIISLIGVDGGNAPTKISRFANYLRNLLPSSDPSVMDMASKAVGLLALAGGTFTAEYVEFEVKRALEWLSGERHEGRRLAAVLVLRELAVNAPTFFYQQVQSFFDNIFSAVRDPKQSIREAAVEALQACFVLTSQRETSSDHYPVWYQYAYDEAWRGFRDPGSGKEKGVTLSRDDKMHGSLLIINELLRASSSEGERLRREMEEIMVQQSTAGVVIRQHPSIQKSAMYGSPGQQALNSGRFLDLFDSENSTSIDSKLRNRIVGFCQSQFCRTFMLTKFPEISVQIMKSFRNHRNSLIQQTLLIILPRLSAFQPQKFVDTLLDDAINHLLSCLRKDKERSSAFLALGLLAVAVKKDIKPYITKIFENIKAALPPKEVGHKRHKVVTVDPSVFICISMLGRALGVEIKRDIRELIDPMLSVGISSSLVASLRDISVQIPPLKNDIQEGLLKILSVVLMHKPLHHPGMPKSMIPALSKSDDVSDVTTITLAIRCLVNFDFEGKSLTEFIKYCAENYLFNDNRIIRIEAVRTCSQLLKPIPHPLVLGQQYDVVSTNSMHLVNEILMKLLTVGITDPGKRVQMMKPFGFIICNVTFEIMQLNDKKLSVDPDTRYCVMSSLDEKFDTYLAQAENLQMLFIAINDEVFEIRELALCHIGRLSSLNPAYIMPSLRKTLMQILTELKFSGLGRNKEQSARLLSLLISNAPRLTRPYVKPIINTLLPKLKENDPNPAVVVNVLSAVGEQAQVSGEELIEWIEDLFPIILDILQDSSSSSLNKREVALRTMGQVVESTGYVVEPYSRYPNLLETLLSFLKTEQSKSIRRETVRVLGLLGALDPYKHKVDRMKRSSDIYNVQDVLIPETKGLADPSSIGELNVTEMLVSMSSVQMDEFYPAVAIAALMRILKDSSLSSHHSMVVQAFSFIIKSLKIKCVAFLPQIVPTFLNVARSCDTTLKESLLQKLGVLISLVKQHIRNYLVDIFQLIQECWTVNNPMQNTIIALLEQMAIALGSEFKVYLPQIIPQILKTFIHDNSHNQIVTNKLLIALQSFGSNLDDYLHLLLPPIVKLFDSSNQDISLTVRKTSLETIDKLIESLDFTDYASRLIHPIIRAIDTLPEVRSSAMDVLCSLASQFNGKYKIFISMVNKVLQKHRIQHLKYESVVSKVLKSSHTVDSESVFSARPRRSTTVMSEMATTNNTENNTIKKLYVSADNLKRAWEPGRRVNKDDWTEWLRRLSVELLKESPSPALRSCWSLAQAYSPLARDLFNAAFVSCWSELNEEQQNLKQDELVQSIEKALESQNNPEITQALLNLAEFMEHCDKGPLPLNNNELLGDCALRCRAYAKALHYKEEEFHREPTPKTLETLIGINNKLQQPEAAAGVLEYAMKNMGAMSVEETWYEELNEWNKALDVYQKKQEQGSDDISITLGHMRCLEALGEWGQLYNIASERWSIVDDETKQKMARMAAAAAWGLGHWESMEEYSCLIPRETLDGAFYRAVLALHQEHRVLAQQCVDTARDILDTELTAMSSESYNRAYGAMVTAQMLSELEEIIQYNLIPERRAAIKQIWWSRLQGCQNLVEDWQRILQVRSLVITPQEDMETWLKYASLCRKSKRQALSHKTLALLLGSDPSKYTDQPLPTKYPKVTFSYMKHMWLSGQQEEAFQHLQYFVQTMITQNAAVASLSSNEETQQSIKEANNRLLARCYLKLGEWMLSLSQLNEQTITQIIQYYACATEHDKNWYKAWHSWAFMNFEALLNMKNNEKSQHTIVSDDSKAGVSLQNYAVSAVNGFVRSITLSKGNSLQDTLRLLTIWFDYGEWKRVNEALVDGLKVIQIDTWLQVIPQLIARIDTPRPAVGKLITQLLIDIGKQHPQALIYPVTVSANSAIAARQEAASRILNNMREHSPVLAQQAVMVSQELIRVAILWHEMWHESLEEASRLYFGEHNIEGMFAVLEPLHQIMQQGPQTLKETSFNQAYGRDLAEAQEWCNKYKKSNNGADLTQAWDLYYHVFRRISKQLTQMTSLELQYVSPKLLVCRDLELAVPGTYQPNKSIIRIQKVQPSLQVITSKQRPRKLCISGCDGTDYMFLLKGHEDLRQDERVMQLFGLINTLLTNDPETFKRHLRIQGYSVTPLSTNSGLISWVSPCDTLHALIRDYREKKKILLNIEHRIMLRMAQDYDHLTLLQKVEVFEHAMEHTQGDDLARVLWLKSPSSEVWFDRRTNYTRSLAVMSMVGYILGLGDRHPSNLMLHRLSGRVLHIDFGDCFEVAMTREKFPEKIPFRLTRMLINAMEVTGIEGNYRTTCNSVMEVLRDNKDSVMAVLEAFVYDPLLSWRLVEGAPKNKRSKGGNPGVLGQADKDIADVTYVGQSTAKSFAAQRELKEALDRQNKPEELNKKAVAIINRVRDKLTGTDFSRHNTLDVPTQVDLLIKQATSHENLCQCYIGW
ncbi:Serine/threonine-protein kinase mTOR [Trichoplax sp. H2]|nr:Serine/threonine-protein kinase mTOR [Trichoplax sp. H2]|eukprot:RDD40512.1 Serine/threonine-protein kinase mTOR [Trichoplax sp. H2]